MKKRLMRIEWADDSDWPWFWLLGIEGHMVHLQGADYPDGSAQHEGDSFWVPDSQIAMMHDYNERCAACGDAHAVRERDDRAEYSRCPHCGSVYVSAEQSVRNKLAALMREAVRC